MIKILRYEVSFFMIPLDTLYYVMYSIMHKAVLSEEATWIPN